MKKIIITFWITLLLSIAGIAYATANVPITVPSAPGAGYTLISTTTGKYIYTLGGSGTISTSSPATPGYFPFWASPSTLTGTSSIFQNGINIGIGTTSPVARLSVKGSGLSTGLLAQFTDSLNVPKVTILDNGSVGIGTSTLPQFFLDVSGNQTARIYNQGGNNQTLLQLQNGSSQGGNPIFQIYQNNGSTNVFSIIGSGAITATGDIHLSDGTNDRFTAFSNMANAGAPGSQDGGGFLFGKGGTFSGIGAGGGGYFGNERIVNFFTGNDLTNEKMIIRASGNVGVGTSSPIEKLAVGGGAYIGGNLTATGTVTMQSFSSDNTTVRSDGSGTLWANAVRIQDGNNLYWGTTPMIGAVANSYLALSVNSSEKMRLLANGNVGIGTTTPVARLSVQGGIGSTSPLFMIASSSNDVYMNVLANGNVGIGTTTPYAKLFINQSGASDTLGLSWTGAGAGVWVINPFITGVSNGGLSFVDKKNSRTPFVISDAGKIGVGTTSPQGILHIDNNQNAATKFIVSNANAGTTALSSFELHNDDGSAYQNSIRIMAMGTGYTTAGAYIQDAGVIGTESNLTGGMNFFTAANAPIRFYTNGYTNERMRISESGNVGIGTTTPTAPLHVNGLVAQTNSYGEIYLNDASTAQSIPTGATYTKFTGWTNDGENAGNVQASSSQDKLIITRAGKYKVTVTLNASVGTINTTWRGAVFVGDVEHSDIHFKETFTALSTTHTMTMSGIITATSTSDVDVRVRHDNGGSVDYTAEYGNINIVYLGE